MEAETKCVKLKGFDFWRTTLKSAKYVVAPMVDQSELAWRMFSRKYGAELCYSPMYHASVFVRDEKYRKEALNTCEKDRPFIIQFCANDPDILLKAGKLAESYCDAIDLNLGCPQLIAKKGHYGAFLQDEWDLLQKMVKTCHENLKVPITCKIRVFESIEKTILYAQMLERAGCQLLTVHGRHKDQKGKLTGVASWEHIKAVRDNVTIPVFANGNIQYLSDIERCLKETNVHGVMTAEGNLHNPALFTGVSPPVWQMAEEYLEYAVQYPCPMSYVRGHLFKICHHALSVFPDMRQLIGNGKSLDCFKLAVLKLKEKCLTAEAEYKKNPDLFKSHLKFPFWICQPYVRPGPNETVEQSEEKIAIKERLKRHLEITKSVLQNGEDISKNKLKKLIKHPNKIFDKSERSQKYYKCESCGNPKGGKCKFGLCKHCCRKKTLAETLDCAGHRLMFRTKIIRKIQWEEQQRRLATLGEIDVKEHSFTDSCQSQDNNNDGEKDSENSEEQSCDNSVKQLLGKEVEATNSDLTIDQSCDQQITATENDT